MDPCGRRCLCVGGYIFSKIPGIEGKRRGIEGSCMRETERVRAHEFAISYRLATPNKTRGGEIWCRNGSAHLRKAAALASGRE